jgi:UDP-N-acetylmuramoyl-tripeptide--D-alanyl-D-alanine ligase
VALLGVVALAWRFWEPHYTRLVLESPGAGRCERRLTRPVLDESLALGTRFLLAHQKPQGNFDYEYDWRSHTLSDDDNEVRQAGALWGLSLLYQDRPSPQLAAGIERGLDFFAGLSSLVKGARCVAYPGSDTGGMGTVALVALAHVDYLRAASALTAERRSTLEKQLREYLKMLERGVHPSGLWYGRYSPKTCKAQGEPSPYSDGEALLALVKAAKYLGYRELLPTIMASAAAGKQLNIDDALAANADSDTTKGYYQWSSMAFYELATSDFPDTRAYGDVVLRLADWMIDEHQVLTRLRNTGYAFEGITYAYALAKQRGDSRKEKLACVIDVGLQRLIGWQVGGPLSTRFTSDRTDPKGVGGVQNDVYAPGLRIDVTQHQMHATLLARRFVY